MIKSIIHRYQEWKNRCRDCDVDGIDKSLIGHFPNLIASKKSKGAQEYICQKCKTLWILAETALMMSKVVRVPLYEKWMRDDILPNSRQKAVLLSIIGVPDHCCVNIYYPCCVTIGKREYSKTIIIATSGDAFGKFPIDHDVMPLEVSYEISPSKYALPYDVRHKTMMAKEKSMGYAPVNVTDPSGNRYTLHNQMHFVDENGIIGSDLVLDQGKSHEQNMIHSNWADLYLICDHFNNINKFAQQVDAPEPASPAR